jgi:glutamate racemase
MQTGPRPHILVFDSGVGGLSIVRAMAAAGLAVDVSFVADTAWFPYGSREDDALLGRIPSVITAAVEATFADLVVVACNTASTLALDAVRASVAVPVVGVVPAIKPAAAMSKTGVIGLLATPRTVARPYTDTLVAEHAVGVSVLRHGAEGLAAAAEAVMAGRAPDPRAFDDAIRGLFGQPLGHQIDIIVLACTHYPLVLDALMARAPRAVSWVDSGPAIARRVAALTQAAPGTLARTKAWTTGGEEADFTAAAQSEGFQAVNALPKLS